MVTRFFQNWQNPFVRTATKYAVGLTAAALVVGALSVELHILGHAFVSNFLVNVCAGLVVLGLGLAVTAQFTSTLASKKLDELAPRLLERLAEHRQADTISGGAVRTCVISAVTLMAPDHLEGERSLSVTAGGTELCDVCGLNADTTGSGSGVRCAHCGLRGTAWKDTVASATRSATIPGVASTVRT
jgi:hypothetical protein